MGIARMLADVPGYQVVGDAKNGEEAVSKARELMPDVILMDVKMPGMGGLEATRRLRQYNPKVKIIAVTACDDSLHPTRLMQAGAVGSEIGRMCPVIKWSAMLKTVKKPYPKHVS